MGSKKSSKTFLLSNKWFLRVVERKFLQKNRIPEFLAGIPALAMMAGITPKVLCGAAVTGSCMMLNCGIDVVDKKGIVNDNDSMNKE